MYQVVILAAGESSRFWPLNKKHKALLKLMGKPILWFNLKGIEKTKLIKEVIIVQSPKKDVEEELKNYKFSFKIKYQIQPKAKGAGNALYLAREFLKSHFFVLNADVVNSEELILETIKKFEKEKPKAVILGQKTEKPELFGIMKLKKDRILKIVEKPKKEKAPSDIKVVGVYFLEPSFFSFYQKVKKHLYDFEDALSLYVKKENVKVAIFSKLESETPTFIKYPWHLFFVKKYLFENFLKEKIAPSVKIGKNVIIEGKIFIDEGTKIFENSVIKGPCYIGKNCLIGNHTLIRESSNLEDEVLIGAFAEVKNTIFQKGATTHSGYFGDSIIDEETKIGAGTITSNVRLDRREIFSEIKGEKIATGLKSFGTIVGRNTKIGTKVNIMPGKFIGSDCLIWPNSIIFKNIPDNTQFK